MFQKNKEDFICEKCGHEVKGTGYTNHCPKCLWSKHVDINPGDRLSECGGMMEPVRVEGRTGSYDFVHRCLRCGYEKRNKVSPEDDFQKVIEISRKAD
ncbi:MAG TPA: RNHCP domain-containing protein [Candidatus Paceibacterota bacterium]|nr:RNHCP domain-containing protein [Candidatus Paceibacterota bacterium]